MSSIRRPLLFAATAGSLLLGCQQVPASSSAAQMPQARAHSTTTLVSHTTVVHVKPFQSSGALARGYIAATRVKGYCWEPSAATSRSDAFRCFVGNLIYDPCFKSPSGKKVACPLLSPSHVVVIHLTKKLPHPHMGGTRGTFQLQVATGSRCKLDTGATYIVHGKRANYACRDGTWLFGHSNSKHKPWLIRSGKGLHPRFQWVAVKTAWM